MNRLFMWFLLLSKRLYKKKAFLVLLVLIPAVVFGLSIAARDDSGFITVAVCSQNNEDKTAQSIINELKNDSLLIRYLTPKTPDEAVEFVKTGKADAAWIFAENMDEAIDDYVSLKNFDRAMVRVVERESTVYLKISHEKLSGILYKYCADNIYINYIRNNVSELDSFSEQELLNYYQNFESKGDLFEFAYPEGSYATQSIKDANYLISPVRGLLSVIVLLCGLSAAMFCIEDKKRGVFDFLNNRSRPFVDFACIFIAVLNISVVMIISIFILGINISFLRELIALMSFMLCCTVFCMLMKSICPNLKLLGSVVPLIAVFSVAVCPIFFDLKSLKTLQYLFPCTYYINGVFDDFYIYTSLVYSVVGISLIYLIKKIKRDEN